MCQTWCIRAKEFSAHKGISAQANGETSPKRSRKWPKKQKRLTKLEKLLKKTNKIFWVPRKGQNNCQVAKRKVKIIFKGRPIKFGSIYFVLSLVQSCTNFSTSAWEDVWHSGWKFSLLGAELEIAKLKLAEWQSLAHVRDCCRLLLKWQWWTSWETLCTQCTRTMFEIPLHMQYRHCFLKPHIRHPVIVQICPLAI